LAKNQHNYKVSVERGFLILALFGFLSNSEGMDDPARTSSIWNSNVFPQHLRGKGSPLNFETRKSGPKRRQAIFLSNSRTKSKNGALDYRSFWIRKAQVYIFLLATEWIFQNVPSQDFSYFFGPTKNFQKFWHPSLLYYHQL
jgi:hypothetical protein